MVVIEYIKKQHSDIVQICTLALRQGKVVAFPTDTCYGLAVDATNTKAIKRLYNIKGRNFSKPSSVIVPSVEYAKKLVKWSDFSSKFAKKFWPGALTIALRTKTNGLGYKRLSSVDKYLSLRMPKNKIALDLSKVLKRPITATSANLSGYPECYSLSDILSQFKDKKNKPDIVIDSGKLKKQKPSTLVKIINKKQIEILRVGPISEKQIREVLI